MRAFWVGLVVALLAAGGCGGADGGGLAPPQGGSAEAAPSQLYVVTTRGELLAVSLTKDGKAGSVERVGPRRQPQPGVAVRTHTLRVSADGRWVAWAETSVDYVGPPPAIDTYGFVHTDGTKTTTVFLLDRRSGRVQEIPARGRPVTFAGNGLVLQDYGSEITSVTPGSPNRTLHDESGLDVIGAVPKGPLVIDTEISGSYYSARIDLMDYDGAARSVHRLPKIIAGTAGYIAGGVSDDGTRFAVERGDHTDYCGVGPSSHVTLLDADGSIVQPEIAAPAPRVSGDGLTLQGMRLQYVRFGNTDAGSAFALWTSCLLRGNLSLDHPYSAVYRLDDGKWSLVRKEAIAVAAVAGGAVVQPGRFRIAGGNAGPSVRPETGGNALLVRNGAAMELPVSGTDFRFAR